MCLLLVSCGGGSQPREPAAPPGGPFVAALGDSITAGAPLWDPDPEVRAAIAQVDERSQYEHWVPGVRFRNCGVAGERTDQIRRRLDGCARGAKALVVQGGINDIAAGRELDAIEADLRAMVRRGKQLGLRVYLAELLPWNQGFPDAAADVRAMNERIAAIGTSERVRVLPFFATLEDPDRPDRVKPEWAADAWHPSVAGYERLGEVASRAIVPPR